MRGGVEAEVVGDNENDGDAVGIAIGGVFEMPLPVGEDNGVVREAVGDDGPQTVGVVSTEVVCRKSGLVEGKDVGLDLKDSLWEFGRRKRSRDGGGAEKGVVIVGGEGVDDVTIGDDENLLVVLMTVEEGVMRRGTPLPEGLFGTCGEEAEASAAVGLDIDGEGVGRQLE